MLGVELVEGDALRLNEDALVRHATRCHGRRATTITASCRQCELEVEHVEEARLADRIEGFLEGFRYFEDSYDKLVSIEMIGPGWKMR
jgi:cyclopropane fatty-acyl-phospholipid synthase-like methyltransferase